MEAEEEDQLAQSPDIPTKKPTQKKDHSTAWKVSTCVNVRHLSYAMHAAGFLVVGGD